MEFDVFDGPWNSVVPKHFPPHDIRYSVDIPQDPVVLQVNPLRQVSVLMKYRLATHITLESMNIIPERSGKDNRIPLLPEISGNYNALWFHLPAGNQEVVNICADPRHVTQSNQHGLGCFVAGP
jgi:hypothetical protein